MRKALGMSSSWCIVGFLTDNTQLNIKISGSSISVAVNGTGPAVIEIGQQLAWLGSALRPSASSNSISSSEPRISVLTGADATFELNFQVIITITSRIKPKSCLRDLYSQTSSLLKHLNIVQHSFQCSWSPRHKHLRWGRNSFIVNEIVTITIVVTPCLICFIKLQGHGVNTTL